MITDLEFDNIIHERTGKEIGLDYGFIAGTETPYYNNTGFMSGDMVEGFIVWKRNKDGSVIKKSMRARTIEENIENVVNFLNNDGIL